MNSKLLLPLIVLLLLAGTAFYYLSGKNANTDAQNGDWVMHVEKISDIHRVFIADRKGGKADIMRDGKHWTYNGKYRANPHVMSNVLNVLTRVRLKNRPPASAIPNMINTLSTKSTKVEVYGKNDKLLKSYYIGGVTPDERGTFMIMEDSNNPYVMHIPNNEVSLGVRFFTEAKKWRDKTVFELQPQDIASVSIEYPKRKNKSFNLKRNKGIWTVDPFYTTTRKIDKEVNQDLVNSYLKEYRKVGAESILVDEKQIKKMTNQKEFCILKLLFTDGTREQLNFFPVQKFEGENQDIPLPVVRYLAINERKDAYLTQHLVFKELFWAYDFFFEG